MRKLLSPSLAAIALPTSVNVEEIYLACKSSSQLYPYLEVAI